MNRSPAITDRKGTPCEKLSMFDKIRESINEFIFEHDLHGSFLNVYPGYVGFLGYSSEELLGRNMEDLLLYKEKKLFQHYLGRVIEHSMDEGLLQLITKSGQKRIVEHRNFLAVQPDGSQTIQGIARDVTEMLETEQALMDDEIRVRSILDSIEDGYFEVDLRGNLTFFNDAIPHQFGYHVQELIDRNFKNFMDASNVQRVFETFHKVFLSDTSAKVFDWELIKKDGSAMCVESSISLRKNRDGKPVGFCGIIRDITERKRAETQLAYMAYHDELTGLHNRKAFLEKLEEDIREARRYDLSRSILYLDLDHFKRVNDLYGHEVGDRLLMEVASRLKDIMRDTDYISRLGGDEFTIILGGPLMVNLNIVASRILDRLSRPYTIDDIEITFISTSIGTSSFPSDGQDVETLLKRADNAMYKAKEKRNSFVF